MLMKIKQDYVSDQFHQVYFTFSAREMDEIIQDVLAAHGLSEREAKRKKKYISELVMEKIEEEIIEREIMNLDVIPIYGRKFRYLTRIHPGNPLLVICQFCILPSDLKIDFPPKIPKKILEMSHIPETVRTIVRQILIENGEYAYKNGEVAKKGSIVICDIVYKRDDYVISEIENQEINLNNVDQPECALFLNSKVGDEIVLDDETSVTVVAKVKEIKNLAVNRLTDAIVKKLNFLNTKTVLEFNKKISDIITFSGTIVVLLNYLAEYALESGSIEFDEYVLDFFMGNEFAPNGKKERDRYLEEVKRDLAKEYIIWLINLNNSNIDPAYMDRIYEEYELDKMLFNNPMRIDGYQEFINRHAFEARVLQYCIDNKIIDKTN